MLLFVATGCKLELESEPPKPQSPLAPEAPSELSAADKDSYNAAKAFLQKNPVEGVYYDGGWEDEKNGVYELGEERKQISKAVYLQLRKDRVLGGNTLRTFKARRWHPYIGPGEKDPSVIGDRFYRDAPYKYSDDLF